MISSKVNFSKPKLFSNPFLLCFESSTCLLLFYQREKIFMNSCSKYLSVYPVYFCLISKKGLQDNRGALEQRAEQCSLIFAMEFFLIISAFRATLNYSMFSNYRDFNSSNNPSRIASSFARNSSFSFFRAFTWKNIQVRFSKLNILRGNIITPYLLLKNFKVAQDIIALLRFLR